MPPKTLFFNYPPTGCAPIIYDPFTIPHRPFTIPLFGDFIDEFLKHQKFTITLPIPNKSEDPVIHSSELYKK